MLLLILAACGSPAPAPVKPSMPTEMAAPVAGMSMPASGTVDQGFIDMMVPHHEGALAMAKVAQARGEHPEIKATADRILTSQQAEIQEMKAWRKAWFGSDETPAMGMPMAHSDMPGMGDMPAMSGMTHMAADIEGLKTATPFDLAFLDAMIPHHEGAVMMARGCADKAQHAEIKSLAADIIRDQEQEITQMQEWRKAWYPAAGPSK